jgi:CheY-like chemotaxis protein
VVRLRGALENLIDNAVKFTDRGAVGLEVASQAEPGGRLKLSFIISDTGIGIQPAAVKRLFRPYAQASADVARLYGGAGLGLISVKRIAKAMQGDLSVESPLPASSRVAREATAGGHGSRFRLDVIVARARAAKARQARASSVAPQRLRILCAEDNPFGRVILDTILGELGHSTAFAANGEAAVEAAARETYDAVLMDVALPGLDGLAAARRIRALPGRAGRVPIIGISGRSGEADEAAGRAAGMNLYLRKPVSPQTLATALAAIADQSDR